MIRQTFLAALGASALAVSGASAASVTFAEITGGTVTFPTPASGPAPTILRTEEFAGVATEGGNDKTVDTDAQARTAGNTITTPLGTFTGLGGSGSGNSVTGNADQIQIRSGNNFGRSNVLTDNGNFLDSNDTLGFSWTFDNTPGLLTATAFITDPNDAGEELTVSVDIDGESIFEETIKGKKGNGTLWQLDVDFSTRTTDWTQAILTFRKSDVDDGFAGVFATSAIPLPAPALLLLGGLAALGGLSLRRRA